MPNPQSKFTKEERLAIGKRVHEGEWPTLPAAAAVLGVHKTTLDTWVYKYRVSIGVAQPRPSEMVQYHKGARVATNGSAGTHPAPVHVPNTVALDAEIRELKHRLAHAMEESHTLQKLLIAVGKTL